MTSNSKEKKIQSKLAECSQPLENLKSGNMIIYACSYILFAFIFFKKKSNFCLFKAMTSSLGKERSSCDCSSPFLTFLPKRPLMLFDNEATQLWPGNYWGCLTHGACSHFWGVPVLPRAPDTQHSIEHPVSTFTFRTTSLLSDSFKQEREICVGVWSFPFRLKCFWLLAKLEKQLHG